jgi:hypothetical protein
MFERHTFNQKRSDLHTVLLDVIRAAGGQLGVAGIENALAGRWAPQTIETNLIELIDEGLVVRIGRGGAKQFRLAPP